MQELNQLSPIVEYLNSVRTMPLQHIGEFKKLSESVKSNKQDYETYTSLIHYLDSIINKPLHPLQQNELMNRLADSVISSLDNIKSEEDLKTLASKSYCEFTSLSLFTYRGESVPEKIIKEMILAPESRKTFMQTKSNRLIGVAQKTVNTVEISVLVIADDIEIGAERPFEEKMMEKLNMFRFDQNYMASSLNDFHEKTKKNFGKYKEGLITDVDTFMGRLKRSKSLQVFKLNSDLTDAAREYFEHLEQSNAKTFFSQDEEYLKISIAHYVAGFNKCHQFVLTGPKRAEQVLLELLISESDENRSSRKSLMNSELKFVGIHQGIIRGQYVTVLVVTDRCDPIVEKSFPEEFIIQLNRLRGNPKTYVKYLQKIVEEARYVDGRKSLKENQNYLKELEKLIELLKTSRSYGPFVVNDVLNKISAKRWEVFVESEPAPMDESELKAYLSEWGTGFKTVCSAEEKGNISAKDILLKLLTEKKDFLNNIVFNRHLNFIGICRAVKSNPPELRSPRNSIITINDNTYTVIIFADKFEPTAASLRVRVHNHRRRLNRPELTEDEVLQVQKDFKVFDVMNSGYVKPETMLVFMNRVQGFAEKNPVYYQAWNYLNTDENNSNLVNSEEFLNAVANVMKLYTVENKWGTLFSLYTNKRLIDFNVFQNVTQELGYRLSTEEIEEIMAKLNQDERLDVQQFTEIMNCVEKTFLKQTN
jgi:Ca2+-binding EF-hand superfamily protein